MVEVLCDEGFIVDVQDGRKRQRRPLQLLVKALSFVAASYAIRRHVPNGIVGFSQNSLDKNARLGDQALGAAFTQDDDSHLWQRLEPSEESDARVIIPV